MRSFRQLLRQPIRFLAGLVLMTVATAIVCVCVGQALAARNTAEQLDQQFTTVALPAITSRASDTTNGVSIAVGGIKLSDDLRQWLNEMAQSDSGIVETVAEHGIISAHIPELTLLNYTQSSYTVTHNSSIKTVYYNFTPQIAGMPYSSAMLVVKLNEISEPEADTRTFVIENRSYTEFPSMSAYYDWYVAAEAEGETRVAGYTVSLSGTVTEVVSLQEGYRDPTGMTAWLTVKVPTLENLEALDLKTGESYLVYGMDYYDEDWELLGMLADASNMQIDAFDLDKLDYLSEAERQRYGNGAVARYDNRVLLDQEEVDQINAISLTLNRPVTTINYQAIRDENGYLQEIREISDISYTDRNGETVTMSPAEYTELYQIPTITRLEGSVEDFLQSEDGALWQEALERDEINNHAFAVMGVDDLRYLADFAMEESRITQGRDFTEEELDGGTRVCIINEAVAVASGLKVGDTITLNLYNGDPGLPYQEFRAEQSGILTPVADFYFDTTPIEETAEYTIVGFWRSKDTWVDVALNEYGFSPNTVFVPKSSIETELEYPDSSLYTTVVLHNGMTERFTEEMAQAGLDGSFIFYDQGYSEIAPNFHNYDALAGQVLTVGATVYGVILALFLLLFPGTQGKVVATMESLGVTRGLRLRHVMHSSLLVVGPASVLGSGIGVILWQSVLDALQAMAETTVTLQLEIHTLAFIALTQFVLAMLLSAVIAVWVTRPRCMAKRRLP